MKTEDIHDGDIINFCQYKKLLKNMSDSGKPYNFYQTPLKNKMGVKAGFIECEWRKGVMGAVPVKEGAKAINFTVYPFSLNIFKRFLNWVQQWKRN